jgi:hypothetical protein
MGVSSSEICYILEKLRANNDDDSSEYILDLILHGVSGSRWPSFIQFNGHNGCLEIPELLNFPPSTAGYTFLFWLYIEK